MADFIWNQSVNGRTNNFPGNLEAAEKACVWLNIDTAARETVLQAAQKRWSYHIDYMKRNNAKSVDTRS